MKLYWTVTLGLLMISVGMSLDWRHLVQRVRGMSFPRWIWLYSVSFLLPVAIGAVLIRFIPMPPIARAGLMLVAMAPGAPLLTRNISRLGFDASLAATYQVMSALATPIILPLVILVLDYFYQRDLWVAPRVLLWQVLRQQLLPLGLGMAAAHFWPARSERWGRRMASAGNVLLMGYVLLILYVSRQMFGAIGWKPWSAVLLLAASTLLSSHLLLRNGTLAVCNTNRYVGLALLVAGTNFTAREVLPYIASYALAAPLVIAAYVRAVRKPGQGSPPDTLNP
jgi:BASS family bile acid:Na+ symporter